MLDFAMLLARSSTRSRAGMLHRRRPLATIPQPQMRDGSTQQQQQTSASSSAQQARQALPGQQAAQAPQQTPPQQQQQQPQPRQAREQQLQPQQSHEQQPQHQHQQLQQQKRRVREDENSVIVRGNRYTKLECVGRGGSSKVFKVCTLTIS